MENISYNLAERRRRLLVNLVFVIYWLVIFEGAIRKWLLPNFSSLIYFIEDPFILLTYFLSLKFGIFPKRNALTIFSFAVFITFIVLVVMQTLFLQTHPLVTAFGMRTYFWCIPLALLIGELFRGEDLARLVRETLLVSIPLALLVIVQFKSPPNAWVNKYLVPDYEPVLVGEVVRTCGTFSYITGQEIFVASLLTMLLTYWLLPRSQRPLNLGLGLLATLAIVTSFLLNGSRGILLFATLTVLSAIAYLGLVVRQNGLGRSFRSLAIISLLPLCTIALMITAFPLAWTGQSERLTGGESLQTELPSRILLPFTTMSLKVLGSTPLLGFGIGMGTAGGAAIAILGGERGMILNENEWPRIIEEGGVFGLLYLSYRLFLTGWLFAGAVKSTRLSTNPMPILLFSFSGVMMATQALTGGGVVTLLGWLFAGFNLAANRLGERVLMRQSIAQTVLSNASS